MPCAYLRTASGTNTVSSTAHHASDPATGCATGQAAPSGTGALPNRSRRAVVTALSGFHSASVRSHPGVRIAYLGGQVASGAYPRLAAAFAEDAGPIDLEAVFEWAVRRVLDGFEHGA